VANTDAASSHPRNARYRGVRPRAPAEPSFEVASVRPNKSGQDWTRFALQPGGRFTATNFTLKELLRLVYQVKDFQLQGGPGWINSERFDIVAKAGGNLPPLASPDAASGEPSLTSLMIRSLLAERFKLAPHHTRDAGPVPIICAGNGPNRPEAGPATHPVNG